MRIATSIDHERRATQWVALGFKEEEESVRFRGRPRVVLEAARRRVKAGKVVWQRVEAPLRRGVAWLVVGGAVEGQVDVIGLTGDVEKRIKHLRSTSRLAWVRGTWTGELGRRRAALAIRLGLERGPQLWPSGWWPGRKARGDGEEEGKPRIDVYSRGRVRRGEETRESSLELLEALQVLESSDAPEIGTDEYWRRKAMVERDKLKAEKKVLEEERARKRLELDQRLEEMEERGEGER